MILESVSLLVRQGEEPAFEQAFARAAALIAEAAGHVSHELRRSTDTAQLYLLLVEWRRLEDRTLSFSRSPAQARLQALLGQFLQSEPEIAHYGPVLPLTGAGWHPD